MALTLEIHPKNPQPRFISQAVETLRNGGVIAYPTDTSYALGAQIGDKQAADTMRRIRRLDDKHDFTLICNDLSQVSTFTRMGNDAHRLIKKLTPGPFTFILEATREVPRRLQHAKKKTIGVRIPEYPIAQALVAELGEPLLTTTLLLPDAEIALQEADEIEHALGKVLDLIIDAGFISYQPTTVIACMDNGFEIIRQGVGVASMLE